MLREVFRFLLGSIIIVEIVCTQIYLAFIQKSWTLSDSLPLHMCRLSYIIFGIVLITKKQSLYEGAAYLVLERKFLHPGCPEDAGCV